MSPIASTYLFGAVVVGGILIADNIILIRKKGIPDTTANGKAVGWTSFFMLSEISWAGASAVVLLQGLARPIVPALYLIFTTVALATGAAANLTTGPVRSFQMWYVKTALIFSCIFTVVAVYELVLSLSSSAL